MNRIILIGNGFDLAHGLRTSYKDFINWYWLNRIKNSECLGPVYSIHHVYDATDGAFILITCYSLDYISEKITSNSQISDLGTISVYEQVLKLEAEQIGEVEIKINSKFLKHICMQLTLNNWVDVEVEYNKELHKIIKNIPHEKSLKLDKNSSITSEILKEFLQKNVKDNDQSPNDEILDIERLNKEFRNITTALEEYLQEIVNDYNQSLNDEILKKIYSSFDSRDFTEKGIKHLKEEYTEEYTIDIPRNPRQILFLNFNYTDIEKRYTVHTVQKPGIEIDAIHIHGELGNEKNPIIFGYGDEIDDEYPTIEKMNDNRFLENIKSIRYLETDNYKRLLNFINSDAYQIFIMGHSCGISDRTLLNTLFEHDNCVSIKVFYYKHPEGDNYQEVIKNISRNFNKKADMREKVVNKMYSESLT